MGRAVRSLCTARRRLGVVVGSFAGLGWGWLATLAVLVLARVVRIVRSVAFVFSVAAAVALVP
jgi:hypothetical protein